MKEIKHIGFILDGNGRWAKKRFLPRYLGHIKGTKNIKNVIEILMKNKIEHMTIYTFSTENWKRPLDEVKVLFNLFYEYLTKSKKYLMENDIRVNVIGSKYNLDTKYIDVINDIQNLTKNNKKFTLNIAFNYGGRQEIVDAVNNIIKSGKTYVTEDLITENLYSNSPFPDLIIRTGGEYRLSNFLLWQSSYSEIYISDVYWPDFDENEFNKILNNYNLRDRKFGGI